MVGDGKDRRAREWWFAVMVMFDESRLKRRIWPTSSWPARREVGWEREVAS